MDRDDIIEKLAFYFEIEPNEEGKYDLDDYDWQAGCSFNGSGIWLNLANIVEALAD